MVIPVVSRAPSSSPSSRVLPSLAVGSPTPQYNTVSSEPLLRNETGCEDENYGEGVTVSILLLVLGPATWQVMYSLLFTWHAPTTSLTCLPL